jgi:hypothetical protein
VDEEGNSNQKPYFSGKKKAHTVKTQIAVAPDGFIEAVSESVPGSTHDLTLLRDTQLREKLDPDEGSMFDKAYDGIAHDFPCCSICPTKLGETDRSPKWSNSITRSYRAIGS